MTEEVSQEIEENAAPLTDESAPSPADTAEENDKPSNEEAEAKESEAEADSGDKKGNRVQKRINELTREKYEALREKEELEERLKALEAKMAPSEPQKPTLAGCDYDEATFEAKLDEYYRAKQSYESETKSYQDRQAEAQQRQQAESQERAQKFAQRIQAEKSAYDNFDEYANDPTFAAICNTMSQDLVDAVRDSENPTALTYHLATNLDVTERLASMSPIRAAQELVRLEAKLTLPESKKVSDAPPPMKPVVGKQAKDKSLYDESDIDEWLRIRNAQIQR